MTPPADFKDRLSAAFLKVRDRLLAERNEQGHWTGELSTSALSTATAVMAMIQLCRNNEYADRKDLARLIDGGLQWLAAHQNTDGGWGDTVKSFSNISTTMLVHAVYHAAGRSGDFSTIVSNAKRYIDKAGGVQAVVRRYGKDKTFSVPILTHCALAGLVEWKQITSLPFEMACVPARFYKTVRLPVVSYALPALIAIGQVKFHFCKPWNPISRFVRSKSINRSLKVLEKIQPENGGFLEAAPLTSFVTMSLAAMGQHNHIVAKRGLQFLIESVRDDGSWPIDTNLATWATTLSVNALGENLPVESREVILNWLLGQQYRQVHPFTNADPGGWAWTDLPGGVPDADDTPGAMLAIRELGNDASDERCSSSIDAAIKWLLGLQNSDGGWPTFCKGWGTLPFDRSSADITAHALRALLIQKQTQKVQKAMKRGFEFLKRRQRSDGSWYPLWFGNQHHPEEENPTYGTARVLMAYRDAEKCGTDSAQRGFAWLQNQQNSDGGWGGQKGIASTIEETSLAVEALLSRTITDDCVFRGLQWLIDQVEADQFTEPTPIGFYFAKLWYFERLYPLTFLASALNRSVEHLNNNRFESGRLA